MTDLVLARHPGCNPACRVCHYKSDEYPEQLRRKSEWARSQLGAWMGAMQDIVPAPESERISYRSKSWLRSHFADGELSFGMYRAIQRDGKWGQEFVSWNTCPLHVPAIQEMIGRMREVLARDASEFCENSLEGVWVGLPHLVVVARDQSLKSLQGVDWSKILVPPFDRVWFHCNPQVGRKIFGHHEIVPLVGAVTSEVHPIRAFRQVAQSLLVDARAQAVEHLLSANTSMVVDLYCGTGDLSLSLPAEVSWLGIELSSEAVKYAETLKKSGRARHAAYVGTVEHRLRDPKVLSQISGDVALYVNPPRSGLTDEARERVLAILDEHRPQKLAYLSCSASSLARDLKVIEAAGYRIDRLQSYDFFPQTEHFETLALLSRQEGRQ